MSTSFTEQPVRTLSLLLLALLVAGCSSTGRKPAVDNVVVVKPVREQVAAPVAAASASEHVTMVPATAEVQAQAPAALNDYFTAISLMRQNKLDDALIVLQGISGQYPQLSGPLVNEGLIYLRQERWMEAIDMFDRALKINVQNPYAWNLRGVALREVGHFAEARASYQRALDLDPKYAKAHFNMGVLADIYLQDLPVALRHYEQYQSLQKKPDQAVGNWIADLRNRTGIAPPDAPPPAPAGDAAGAPAPAEAPAGTDGDAAESTTGSAG